MHKITKLLFYKMKLMICILLVITTGFFSTRKWEQVVGGWGGGRERATARFVPPRGVELKRFELFV